MLHPAEQAHIGVGQVLGGRATLLDGGVGLVDPVQSMRSFNCVSCWSAAALPTLIEYARSFYPGQQRPPVIALTDRLPPSAHALLLERGWKQAVPRQLFMQRPAAPPPPAADVPIQPLAPELVEPFVALISRSFGWDTAFQQEQTVLYRRQVAEQIGRHYVALIDGTLVATTSILPSSLPHAASWGLYKVTTHPDYRGRGLATALISRAIHDALAAGGSDVFLYTDPASPAVSLYERLAFAPLFIRTFYIWPDPLRVPD